MKTYQDIQNAFIQLFFEYRLESFEKYLELVSNIDSDEARNIALVVRAELLAYTGRSVEALELVMRASGVYVELNDQFGLRISAGCLANVYWRMGNYEMSIEHFSRSMDTPVSDSNDVYTAYTQINLGNVYSEIGEYAQALQSYQKSLMIYESSNAVSSAAGSISNIGLVYGRLGESQTCLEYLTRAAKMFQENGYEVGLANVLGNIGGVYAGVGKSEEALDYFERSIVLAKKHSMSREQGYYSVGLAEVLREVGRPVDALKLLDENSDVISQNPYPIAGALRLRAMIHQDNGNYPSAKEIFLQALEMHTSRNERADASDTLKSLRDLAKLSGDFDSYIKCNEEHLRMEDSIKGAAAIRKLGINEKELEIEKERKERELERLAQKAERERELAVLHSTLPKHIADRVVRGEVVNDHVDDASVMFIDIVGFTSISSRIPAGHVVHLLDSIFAECDNVCTANSVTRIKTIGDSYMAVAFPATGPTHHTFRMAIAAEQIMQSLHDMELVMPGSLGDTSWVKDVGEIQVRIGLHSGPIVAGVLGKERMQYDVWGDTVNVASRMESTGEPGRIHVSEAFQVGATHASPSTIHTHALPSEVNASVVPSAARDLSFVPRGEIEVKGKGTMKTYWLSSEL